MEIKFIKARSLARKRLLLMLMKTFIFLLCSTVFGFTSENTFSQKTVLIDQDQLVTVDQVFKIIKQQTDFKFIYPKTLFKNTPKVQLKKGTIRVDKLLNQSLGAGNFNVVVSENNTIIIKDSKSQDPIQVVGKVLDEAGLPVSGATVLIKGTNIGVVTDFDGSYTILVPNQENVLVFSALGFASQEISVTNKQIDVILKENISELDEVTINAGYYKTSQKEKTGSITEIDSKTIETQVSINPLASLQGRLTGVHVVQNSGVPGSGFNVQIRGKNSIASGNMPLYIIDGVPYNSQSLSSMDVSGSVIPNADFSPFSFLSPSDIEKIEVLKDADATAIYGSRGANGVILITTKKGHLGTTKYAITVKNGLGHIAKTQKLLNTEQYLNMRQQAFANDGITEYPSYEYDVNGTWDSNRYTDWQKELIGGTAYFQEYQGSVSGGNNTTSFFVSGGYHSESTVFPEDNRYKRANSLAKINHRSANDGFRFTLSTVYSLENNNLPGADLSFQALILPPNAPKLFNDDGSLNWEDGTFNNPMAALEGDLITKRNSLLVNALTEIKLIKNLTLKTNFGYQDSNLSEYRTYPNTRFPPQYGLDSRSSAIYTNDGNRNSWIIEPQLSYSYKREGSRIEVLAGYSGQTENSNNYSQYAQGFANNSQIMNLAAANYVQVTDDSEKIYNYQALFGRINYTHNDKYVINLTGRRDGSSRFGPNNRFANFGAIGVAWIFSEEVGIKNVMSFLSYGKLRGSYGSTGNDQIGDYRYFNSFSSTGISYNGTIGLYPTALYNPDFGWEENRKLEMAMELGFLNNRITTNINYYHNRSSNQLVEIPLPGTTGFSAILANLNALVENKGWEFELNTLNIKSDKWNWKTSFNVTFPRNKLLEFPNLANSTYANSYVIGEPITIRKVLHFTGVDPQTGIYTFEDYNGDGKISLPEDTQKIVDTAPKFYGGVSNTITFKNLELDIFFQFNKQFVENINIFGTTPGVMTNQSVEVLNAWTEPGDQTNNQAFTSGSNFERTVASLNYRRSDAAFSDASYLRLKNISLSYNLNNIFSKSSNTKIFIQGQNLLTFTKYKGQDPEQTQGFIPALRWIGAGFTLTF